MAVGIIAEYNPFHNGHIFQLNETKKRFPGETIVIALAGEFVQRGEIAVASFNKRKQMALKYGAHKVIKIPFAIATQAAHIFAGGAIKLLAQEGVSKIFFGSESNNPNQLMAIAKAIYKNQDEYNKSIKFYLKKDGNSFPKSAALALKSITGTEIVYPNDILGLEYCKAIVFNDLKIKPYTLKRTISFHSQEPNNSLASASYIRKLFWEKKDYSQFTPMKLDPKRKRIEDYYHKFQTLIKTTPVAVLKQNHMISEGMENLFKKHIDATSMETFINNTNSKRYTSSRIKRTILWLLKDQLKSKF